MQWKLRVTLTLNSGWFTGSWSNRPVVLLYTICRTFIVAIGRSNSRFLEILDGMQISKDYQKDDAVYTDTGRILLCVGKRRTRYASLWCRICRLLRRMDGQSLLSTASLSGRSRWSGVIARKYLHEHLADSTRFRLFHLVLEHMAANTGLLIFKMLMWAPIDLPSSKLKWASQSVWLRNTSVKCVSIVSSPRLESWNFNQNLHVTLNRRTKRLYTPAGRLKVVVSWTEMQLSALTSISSVFQIIEFMSVPYDDFNGILSLWMTPSKTEIVSSCCRVELCCIK